MDPKTEGRAQRFVSLLCRYPKFSGSEDDDEEDKRMMANRCTSYRIYADGSGVGKVDIKTERRIPKE
jgi:hypothetical protein